VSTFLKLKRVSVILLLLLLLCAEARVAWSRSLWWWILVHIASHFETVVSDALHTRLHHLLIWHLERTLGHAHGLPLPHHLHLLTMHLHIHSLNLDHVADLARTLALSVDAEALDATNRSLSLSILHLHSLWSLSIGLHVVFKVVEDAIKIN
jgi:hypothetical protein